MKISRHVFLLVLLTSFVLLANVMHLVAVSSDTETDDSAQNVSSRQSGRYKRQYGRRSMAHGDHYANPYARPFRGVRPGRWGVAGHGALRALLNQNLTIAQIKEGVSKWLDATKKTSEQLSQVITILEKAGDKALASADQDKVVELLTQIMHDKVVVLKAGTQVRGAMPVFSYIFSHKLLSDDKQEKLKKAIKEWHATSMQSAAREFLGNMSLSDIQKKLQGRDSVENLVEMATVIKNAQNKVLADPDQIKIMALMNKEKIRQAVNHSRLENMLFKALLINLSNNNLVSPDNKIKIDQYLDELMKDFGKSRHLFGVGHHGKDFHKSVDFASTGPLNTQSAVDITSNDVAVKPAPIAKKRSVRRNNRKRSAKNRANRARRGRNKSVRQAPVDSSSDE